MGEGKAGTAGVIGMGHSAKCGFCNVPIRIRIAGQKEAGCPAVFFSVLEKGPFGEKAWMDGVLTRQTCRKI